ncbi:sigma-70 family RNA polymerase sigma factor [Lysobacter sp. SG-8]|uniref:Sigma-70 family RNA polymerase sigma factor n=1 Tax=Marilutibacter penaei TaxID=2759900 RepID=A0A7W3YEM3_9GAMM|nr:sigma-70 family RNA polymerase sigma factor [Lysobacter penaei]MBB1088425.1 sigma-70 family RNA polymerase sigma factor [Lysobacter penaei]
MPSPPAPGDTDTAPPTVAWDELMARAQDGDRIAYRTLLTGITPYLHAIARRYLGPDTDDAVQEILLVVHDIRHTYEPSRPFKPWLGTIASRRCIDLLRRRGLRARHERALPEDGPEPVDTGATPLDRANHDEAARALHAAIETLPPRQREAVRLLRLREMSLGEAAAHSRQTPGALKVAYHRALKSLRRALGPEETPDD